jgi:predicted amino acid racemase
LALTIDAAAIAHNASVIRATCDDANFVATAVIKKAYALPAIIEAVRAGGIASFAASSLDAARRVTRVTGRPCGLIGHAPPALARFGSMISSLLCFHADEARAVLRSPGGEVASLMLRTSDGRDGLAAEALLEELGDLASSAGARLGIAMNWGCLGPAPSSGELQHLRDIIARCRLVAGRALPISIGGSTLLPILKKVDLPGAVELRVGEAILTGTVPFGKGADVGLMRPVHLTSTILDVEAASAGRRRLIVDRGWTSIHVSDVELVGFPAVPVDSSSELSIFDLAPGATGPNRGDTVQLALGYRSAVHSLLNRTIRRTIIPS